MEYGLIGEKLGHSFSAIIHPMIDDYKYELCEIPSDRLDDFMKKRDFRAINVTVPYKERVIPYLSWISPEAERIGAVNTVVNKNGKLYGYNTDYFGISALIQHLRVEITDKKVLILGTGGTSKTASAVMEDMGAREIIKVSRSEKSGAVTYQLALHEHTDSDIIINTTPCGMYPHTNMTPIDISFFPKLTGVIDVIYNPLRTNLVSDAQKRNIKSEGGLYMLVAQAVAASGIFTGKEHSSDLTEKIFSLISSEKRNAVLIGMPTCGKTSVGKELARRTGRAFLDTDDCFKNKYKKTPADCIKEYGEEKFRDMESDVIAEVSMNNGCVIAVGGGSILREKNVRELRKNGLIFWLDRSPSLLKVMPDRPLSDSPEKLLKLYEMRKDYYAAAADIVIKSDLNEGERAEMIEKYLC